MDAPSDKNTDIIHLKYGYGSEINQLFMNKATRGRPSARSVALDPLFHEPPTITRVKYEYLMFLCNSLAIPGFYHKFYRQ